MSTVPTRAANTADPITSSVSIYNLHSSLLSLGANARSSPAIILIANNPIDTHLSAQNYNTLPPPTFNAPCSDSRSVTKYRRDRPGLSSASDIDRRAESKSFEDDRVWRRMSLARGFGVDYERGAGERDSRA